MGVGGFLLFVSLGRFFPSLFPVGSLANLIANATGIGLMLLLPLSIGVAVLRSRLWDIDHLINRTLVYGTLTALLALIYFGLVIALQSFVRALTEQVLQSPLALV